MKYTLLCIVLLLSSAATACPNQCRCPDTIYDLIFEIHCNNASLTQVPNGNFEEALFIDLSFNNITTLENNTFFEKKIQKLVRLYLNNNGMKTIAENAFRGLTQLKLLNLEQNNIGVLLPTVFKDTAKIEVLNLSGNKNLQLPDLGFDLPALDMLLIKDCGLKILPANFFKPMLNLQYIFLLGNELSVFDPQLITPLTQLKRLDLRHNKFTSLQFDLHQTLPEALSIDFEENPLICDCNMASQFTLNKEKKLYDLLMCGGPTNSTLDKFLLDNCSSTTQAYFLVSDTTPAVSELGTSTTPSYTTTTTTTTTGVTSHAIVPEDEDEDTRPRGNSSDRIDTTLDMSRYTAWIALSAIALAFVIMTFITVVIRRQYKTKDYLIPRRFKLLEYDDEEKCYVT